MKRYYIAILLFYVSLLLSVNGNDFDNGSDYNVVIEELRLTYYAGVENEEYIDSLQSILIKKFGEDTSKYSPIALAYQAGLNALKSKHAFWPFTKMTYLNESMDVFSEAVERDSTNLEIRFMRFSILYYVPGILGYNEEEESDMNAVYGLLLEKDFSKINFDLQEGMAQFLIRSELLTFEQESKLSNRFMLAKNE
ncbi:MAG: hypothetical protein U5K00_17670 [Melioribacteraceae bacterium]|nr:hypothetical protein [Melioribacteraceae bacterium]